MSVKVSSTPLTGMHVAEDFASFSYEVPCAPDMFTFGGNARVSFVNLMLNLQQENGGRGPNIRIGGNSADESVYIPSSTPLPTGDTYRISDVDFNAYNLAVHLWNGTITPGVNFRDASSGSLAVAHIKALAAAIPFSGGLIDAIEVGNECDLYGKNGIRPSSFDASQYISEFELYEQALIGEAGLPPSMIQGLTFCCHSLDSGIPSYLKQFGPHVLKSISYHEYPLNVCEKQKNTIYQLLSDSSVYKSLADLRSIIDGTDAAGLPFYIGEGNSVACGGQANVSDVFAATLWSVDSLLVHASAGVRRWNFHGCPQGAYTAIAYASGASTDVPDVRPLYYGMWAFTRATRGGGVLMNVSITTSNELIKAHAIHNEYAGHWTVVLIHKDVNATTSASVTLSLPAAATATAAAPPPSGTLTRLAPSSGSPYAKDGIAFGGLTFDGSMDGKPQGTPVSETVAPNADGSYSFELHPTSVVIFTV